MPLCSGKAVGAVQGLFLCEMGGGSPIHMHRDLFPVV